MTATATGIRRGSTRGCKSPPALSGLLTLACHLKYTAASPKHSRKIVHAAWAVNFRISLRSFERDRIVGLRNQINLALAGPHQPPPKLFFGSSVAAVANYTTSASEAAQQAKKSLVTVPEEIITDPATASELGYSRSKWVAEQICLRAHQQTRLRGRIAVVRIGQLAGDSRTGIWSETEAWPMLLSTVKITGCLPALRHQTMDWLAVDETARAFFEAGQGLGRVEAGREMMVCHVVNNDRTVTWMDALQWLRKTVGFDIVEPDAWIQRLERLEMSSKYHPALKLLSLWKAAYAGRSAGCGGDVKHAQGVKQFAVDKTRKLIPVMRINKPVDEAYFEKIWNWLDKSM